MFDATKLAQNNRQGRKLMQSYFKKRGVAVELSRVSGRLYAVVVDRRRGTV